MADPKAPNAPPPQAVVTVVAAPIQQFGRLPQRATCHFCQADVMTSVQLTNGWLPWAICGGLAFLGLFLLIPFLLCWIPFVVDSCKDVEHYCPNCNRIIGICKAVK